MCCLSSFNRQWMLLSVCNAVATKQCWYGFSLTVAGLFTSIGYFFCMLFVTIFWLIYSYSFLKLFITHTRGTNFEFLYAPIALSSSCSILSPIKKWGSIDQFSVLKKKIVAPWDFFAYKWATRYESETEYCWNFDLKKGFHFAGFQMFLIKKVYNINV